jgi:glycosyltransferase involved in cell wall biosynthesis
MRVVFIHQNFPGQYQHLALQLAKRGHSVAALSTRVGIDYPGVRITNYVASGKQSPGSHPFLYRFERHLQQGIAVAATALKLRKEGFSPDVVCVHPGWGESLYVKDVWPKARQLHYCEYHLQPYNPAQIFDPRAVLTLDQVFTQRVNGGLGLFALNDMDAGVSPTHWQKGQYPSLFRDRISVVHDGINAGLCKPNADASLPLPSGRRLSRRDKVVTYVARNLEPMRGFPQFVRAMGLLLSRDPGVEIVVIGGDDVSYGATHPSGRSWRETMLEEVELDRERVHFCGKLPYLDYLAALQISSAHVYLTAPFVLSWSMLEAMAVGCIVIASDTEPVREIVTDGVDALLFDFFDRDALVDRVEAALREPQRFELLRQNARATILERYSLQRCLPKQIELVEALSRGSR